MIARRVLASKGIALLLATLVFGCSSSGIHNKPDSATGGAVATGGSATAATGGSAGDTGGSNSSAGGTASGSGGAATTGTGGASVDCNPPVVTQCTGTPPSAALISDFDSATGSATPAAFGTWGQSIYGGPYVYPNVVTNPGSCAAPPSHYPLTQDFNGGTWNIQGTVGEFSGGGLWWECLANATTTLSYAAACTIDASAYTGISFTISGDAGPAVGGATTGSISFSVATPATMKVSLDSSGNPKNCGACTAATCGSGASVPVSDTATPVTLTWADLGVTTPNAISGIGFSFTNPCSLNGGYATSPCTPTPFPVNITIDDLQFTANWTVDASGT